MHKKNCDKKHTFLHESPNVNVNRNLINDLYSENEYLQREVTHLEDIENLSKTELSCNKINENPQQNNTATYEQVLSLTVSYGDKELSINPLPDSGSDSTLISKSLADYLNLSGQEREIQFSNAVSSTTKIKSKLIFPYQVALTQVRKEQVKKLEKGNLTNRLLSKPSLAECYWEGNRKKYHNCVTSNKLQELTKSR